MLLVKGAVMPHMVIFRDAEGRPGYHQSEALEDAVRFVEHLRNEQEVSDTRVFSMQEVPLEFKSYWRVAAAPPAPAGGGPHEARRRPPNRTPPPPPAPQPPPGAAAPAPNRRSRLL